MYWLHGEFETMDIDRRLKATRRTYQYTKILPNARQAGKYMPEEEFTDDRDNEEDCWVSWSLDWYLASRLLFPLFSSLSSQPHRYVERASTQC